MFSVLIPVYNHRAFLLDCVMSAIQSPLVTEVLIVDDGSRDNSADMFGLFEQMSAKIRVLREPTGNQGAHVRLNQLARAARNPWLAVLNSDDEFCAGRFEAIVRTAQRGKVDLFFGDLILIDGDGKRVGVRNAIRHNEVPWPSNWALDEMAARGDWLPFLALQNIMATTTNMIFTRRLFDQLGGFRDFRYCHDWDFALRAVLEARVAYAPTMLSKYRIHRGNTIKEASERVHREVRRMLAGVLSDYHGTARRNDLQRLFKSNHYLVVQQRHALAVVMKGDLARALLTREVAKETLPVAIVATEEAVPDSATYIYRPGQAGEDALGINDLREILLAIAVRGYDALLLSRSPAVSPAFHAASLEDGLVVRVNAGRRWSEGPCRLIRLYTPGGEGEHSLELPAPIEKVDHAGGTTSPAAWADSARVVMMAPANHGDPRPVVFILPAFLAVGGVERLVVETMRLLKDEFRFVVVTTEPLRPEQGSTHGEALLLGPVYDLAELVRVEDRIRALEVLRDWHGPAVVWVVNGAPWQADHAAAIRAVFTGTAIVDHQAYDHEAGWINRLGEPGILASDRFVAINGKIRDVMQSRHGIPAAKIDLIYHGSNMARVKPREVGAEDIAGHRRQFGLNPALPVFGMIGRLTAQKRPLDLIELARRVGPKVQFVWIGLGELEADVRAAAADLPHVTLIGQQTNLRPIYEMLDGLIITSEFEGLPIVLIEAMAMGLPVLSTDVGAIAEVVARYGSGLTYSPPGDIDELTRAFGRFRKKLSSYRDAAQRSTGKVAEDFSSERMAREYGVTFRRAMGR